MHCDSANRQHLPDSLHPLILSVCWKELLIVLGLICSLYKPMLVIAQDSIILQILINFISLGLFYYFTVDIRLIGPSFSCLFFLPFVKCVLAPRYFEIIFLYHRGYHSDWNFTIWDLHIILRTTITRKSLKNANIMGNIAYS